MRPVNTRQRWQRIERKPPARVRHQTLQRSHTKIWDRRALSSPSGRRRGTSTLRRDSLVRYRRARSSAKLEGRGSRRPRHTKPCAPVWTRPRSDPATALGSVRPRKVATPRCSSPERPSRARPPRGSAQAAGLERKELAPRSIRRWPTDSPTIGQCALWLNVTASPFLASRRLCGYRARRAVDAGDLARAGALLDVLSRRPSRRRF